MLELLEHVQQAVQMASCLLSSGGWSSCARQSRRQLRGRRCRVQEPAAPLMPVQQSTQMARCTMVQWAMDLQLRRAQPLPHKLEAHRPCSLVQQQQQLARVQAGLSRATMGRLTPQQHHQQQRREHHQTSKRQRTPLLRLTDCWRRTASPQCARSLHLG